MNVPDFTSTSAASVCPRSFCDGVSAPKSSMSPTRMTMLPDSRSPRSLLLEIRQHADGQQECGVYGEAAQIRSGLTVILQASSGRSTIPSCSAAFRITGVQ